MGMFITLIVAMVSQVYVWARTHKMIDRIVIVINSINHISIKLLKTRNGWLIKAHSVKAGTLPIKHF